MITQASLQDLNDINRIGLQIKEDFKSIYKMNDVLDQDYSKVYVYKENDKVIGFIHIENHFEITDIINIAVDNNYHNKGIGTKLLKYIEDNIYSDKIMLEVNEHNLNAYNLYKKLGYKEINRRKKYYDYKDDAIIMEKRIKNG